MKFEKPVVLVDKFELVDTIASSGGASPAEEPYRDPSGGIAPVYGDACYRG